MRISDWSSDVCSSDLLNAPLGWSVDSGWMRDFFPAGYRPDLWGVLREATLGAFIGPQTPLHDPVLWTIRIEFPGSLLVFALKLLVPRGRPAALAAFALAAVLLVQPFWIFNYRSEEHTSELQSLMRISYAVFCLKKKK